MKKKKFEQSNELIRLTDRWKNSSKKNTNTSKETIKLKDKMTEETKSTSNKTYRDEFKL